MQKKSNPVVLTFCVFYDEVFFRLQPGSKQYLENHTENSKDTPDKDVQHVEQALKPKFDSCRSGRSYQKFENLVYRRAHVDINIDWLGDPEGTFFLSKNRVQILLVFIF